MKLYEHLEANPQITVNGFKHAGIHQALGLIDEDEEIPSYFHEESSDVDESDENEFSSDEDESSVTPLRVADVYTTDSNSDSEGEFSNTGMAFHVAMNLT